MNNNNVKKNNNFHDKEYNPWAIDTQGKCGYIEYKMPKIIADQYLKLARNKVGDVQKYLCNIVNTEFGLKGYCLKVIID